MKLKTTQKTKTINAFCGLMSGIILLAGGTLSAQAALISENFSSNTVPVTLETAGPAVSIYNDAAYFDGYDYSQRSYLRTVDNFFSTSFVAEVTMTTGYSLAFFGMGEGSPYGFWGEPGNSAITLRMHPSWIADGRFDVADNGPDSPGSAGVVGFPGSGIHRLQLVWDAISKTAVFNVDSNYTGGTFTADLTSQIINGADNGFSATNSKIYFGGDSSVQFDDFTVTTLNSANAVPEPSSVFLLFCAAAFYLYRPFRTAKQNTLETIQF